MLSHMDWSWTSASTCVVPAAGTHSICNLECNYRDPFSSNNCCIFWNPRSIRVPSACQPGHPCAIRVPSACHPCAKTPKNPKIPETIQKIPKIIPEKSLNIACYLSFKGSLRWPFNELDVQDLKNHQNCTKSTSQPGPHAQDF